MPTTLTSGESCAGFALGTFASASPCAFCACATSCATLFSRLSQELHLKCCGGGRERRAATQRAAARRLRRGART